MNNLLIQTRISKVVNKLFKKNITNLNLDYKVFTTQYDEISKAESLENQDDVLKLRKTLDQQLVGFKM